MCNEFSCDPLWQKGTKYILIQGAILSEGRKVAWANKKFSSIWFGALLRKFGGVRHLGKVLGNLDGRGCLGKVLARPHVRLPVGLSWDWRLEKVLAILKVLLRLHVRLLGGPGWD